MKTKAAASALAVLLLVAALLPSCGKRGEPGGTSRTTDGNTVSGTGTDTENNNLELPDDGFGGRDFRVLAGNRIKWPMWDTVDLTVDESSDPQISSAVFRRNSMVEKRLERCHKERYNNIGGSLDKGRGAVPLRRRFF